MNPLTCLRTSSMIVTAVILLLYAKSMLSPPDCLLVDEPVFSPIENYQCARVDKISVKECFQADNMHHHEPECLIATENDAEWTGLPFIEDFSYSIEPSCDDYNNRFLIIYIYTQVYHFKHRQNMRQKYRDFLGDKLCSQVKVLFVVGQTEELSNDKCNKYEQYLEEEAGIYKDILRINILDSYYNLSYKGFGAIYWISKKCKLNTPFVLKMDDDYTYKLDKLYNTLQSLDCRFKAYQLCKGVRHDDVVRAFWNKFRIPYKEFQAEDYPYTCGGHVVLMTLSAAENLYDVAKLGDLPVFRVDDIYFGALLRRKSCLRIAQLNESDTNYDIIYEKWTEW